MSPRDADGEGDVETADERERSAVELTDSELREEATYHLQEALSATESAEKRFHIRQALQLLGIEER